MRNGWFSAQKYPLFILTGQDTSFYLCHHVYLRQVTNYILFMGTTFNAKLSKFSLFITIVFNIGLLIILFSIKEPSPYRLVLMCLTMFVLVMTHLLHPLSYTIVPDAIKINRLIFSITIQTVDIIHLEKISVADLAITVRLFGSGGVWGYFGIFHSGVHGRLTMMASDMQQLILITTATTKYVISPENTQAFLEAYNNRKKI
jgi:hypothetical protein